MMVLRAVETNTGLKKGSIHMSNQPPRRPVVLIIMDGIGVNPSKLNNAVALASTPNLDRIYSSFPTCLLEASGRAVGLPVGQMGNSEVGHLTLGAGCVLRQDLVKINDAISDGSFYENDALLSAVKRASSSGKAMHLVGLVSDGGVHSHMDHLLALVDLCKRESVKPVVHMITDGRDTAPKSAHSYLESLEKALSDAGGSIATVIGRFYALDRDKRWNRVQAAWDAVVNGVGKRAASAEEALTNAYANDETDEFVSPTVLDSHKPLDADDEVIFFNFRNDRPRELSEALGIVDFNEFDRGDFTPISLTTMTRYESSYPFPTAFVRDEPGETLGKVVANAGLVQLRSAETEKYPHVTFFFNGGQDQPLDNERRFLVDSPKVDTYDLQPEMSAEGIAKGVIDAINSREPAMVVVNFANGDMVGHTGIPDAVVKAVEVVDDMVGKLWNAATDNGYSIVLTADHGNADMLVDPISGEPHTQHTTFPVACAISDEVNWELANGCGLPSIAPTILELMGLPIPAEMTGQSLLLRPQ